MIEGPAGRKARGPNPPSGKRWTLAALKDQLLGIGHALRGSADAPRRRKGQTDLFLGRLQLAGRIFWGVLTALAIYLVIDLWVLKTHPPTVVVERVTAEGGPKGSAAAVSVADQLKPLEVYQQALVGRNPFQLVGRERVEPVVAQTSTNRLAEMASRLKVVGINRGQTPEALVEDADAGRTHFVKVGDQINGMAVTSIDEQGVVVTYEGEEILIK